MKSKLQFLTTNSKTPLSSQLKFLLFNRTVKSETAHCSRPAAVNPLHDPGRPRRRQAATVAVQVLGYADPALASLKVPLPATPRRHRASIAPASYGCGATSVFSAKMQKSHLLQRRNRLRMPQLQRPSILSPFR